MPFIHPFTAGDGRLGYPDGAPYDAIHVGAAAPTIPKAVRTIIVYNESNKCKKVKTSTFVMMIE